MSTQCNSYICKEKFEYKNAKDKKYVKKKVIRIDKYGEEVTKNVPYRLQFIYSERLLASSLSNLINNLSEGIHKRKF